MSVILIALGLLKFRKWRRCSPAKMRAKVFWTCYCKKCDSYHQVYLGCNSRICSYCGKRYSDKWADNLVENTFDVPHKHVVMGLPPLLWAELYKDRVAWKIVMDTAIKALEWFYSETCGPVKPGLIVVAHPFGRDLGFKLHIHIIATKGGFDTLGNFVEWKRFCPFKKIHKKWMWVVCEALKHHWMKDVAKRTYYTRLFNDIWDAYGKEGFVVEVCKPTLRSKKGLAKYVARYVRHPAIADSRIIYFDEKSVIFYYIDSKTEEKRTVVMGIDEFIMAIIQHIPEPQFKMIRHYGAYARRGKKIYKQHLRRSIGTEKRLLSEEKGYLICPDCGSVMKLVHFSRGKPPPDKSKMDAWMGCH